MMSTIMTTDIGREDVDNPGKEMGLNSEKIPNLLKETKPPETTKEGIEDKAEREDQEVLNMKT